MGAASTYPYSRGSIHLASANPSDPPTFHANYISDPRGIDLKIQLWAYKLQRDLIRRCSFYRGELPPPFHPAFPATSSAALELDLPLAERSTAEEEALGRKRLEYSAEDDKIVESFVRRNIGTVWHPACTCAMKPQAAGGVVDEKLDVYGVTGLKLVDLSIIPDIVSANTYSMAVVVGEKAANIIRGELGI
jgi:alcohol oxidase